MILGKLWNIDLWFLDKQIISEAENYCDSILEQVNKSQERKATIINIK